MSDGSSQSDGAGGAAPSHRQAKCPICGRGSQEATRPFCSGRCANVDLSRWLNNGYAIVTHADAEEDETLSPATIGRRQDAGEEEGS